MTSDLITRLSKLDAPDREVDAEIALALDLFETQPNKGWPDRLDYGRREENGSVTWPGHGFDQLIPRYTASVDAAIALAERVLPESVARRLIVFNSSPAKAGFDGTPERGKLFYFEAATPESRAEAIALLRAKEASKL